jgi:dynein heavy chain
MNWVFISQKTAFFIVTVVKTSNVTFTIDISAVAEARDIALYLKPLVKHFDALESTDFKDAQPLLRPLVHCVALVWAHSRYYCTTTRIVTLIREVANLLIQEV